MKTILAAILAGVLVVFQISNAYSFAVPSHRALSDKATSASNLDDFLKFHLNLPGGINEYLAGLKVIEWIQEGRECS